jgi:pilus assembly protein CpaF
MDGVEGAVDGHDAETATAATIIEGEVRELARLAGVDLFSNPRQLRSLVTEVAASYEDRSLTARLPRFRGLSAVVQLVMDGLTGFGVLQRWIDDPAVEEVWVDEPGRIFAVREGRKERLPVTLTPEGLEEIVELVQSRCRERLEPTEPMLEVTLPTGVWVHAVLPPITRKHPALIIRKFVLAARSLGGLVAQGVLTAPAARLLEASVAAGLSIVVSGPPRSGKTTLLNALLAAVPEEERLLCCEDVFELQPTQSDVVSMQIQLPDFDGRGEVTLGQLVRRALRMRPTRLVVGEVRQEEGGDLLLALGRGVPALCTVRADSAHQAILRLAALPPLGPPAVSQAFAIRSIAAEVDLVVHLDVGAGGKPRVREILGVPGRVDGMVIAATALFYADDGKLVRGDGDLPRPDLFARRGVDLAALIADVDDEPPADDSGPCGNGPGGSGPGGSASGGGGSGGSASGGGGSGGSASGGSASGGSASGGSGPGGAEGGPAG